MPVLRFLGNLILAVLLVIIIVAVFSCAYGIVMSRTWERFGLDYGVTGGTWAWIEGRPIYYRTWGPEEGPDLVLVHGHQVEGGETWAMNAETLGKWGMRVTAVDLEGFGHSQRSVSANYSLRGQATLLAQLLNELQVERATVVGLGWGASVALQLAYEQPQFVGKLVLVAPIIEEKIVPLWEPVEKIPYLREAAVWAIDLGGPYRAFSQRQDFIDSSLVTSDYRRRLQEPTQIEGTIEALLAMGASPGDSDLPEAIAELRAPALILLGSEDAQVTSASTEWLESELHDAKRVIIPECGHYLHMEQSARVNRAISGFCLNDVR